jgi:hypothetical protein
LRLASVSVKAVAVAVPLTKRLAALAEPRLGVTKLGLVRVGEREKTNRLVVLPVVPPEELM